jgi:hypothetical protein
MIDYTTPRDFKTEGRLTYKTTQELEYDYDGSYMKNRLVCSDAADSDLVSSLLREDICGKNMHMPAIDIDLPIRVVPSSTLGHFHLYIDKPMSWRKYKRVLRALTAAGVVEKGYYKASVSRKATHLRLPWHKKQIWADVG